jgi:hypothetical protein
MATLIDKIESQLSQEGVTPFSNENIERDYLKLPRYLDELPAAEIGRYLHATVQQRVYVRTLISQTRAYLREAQSQLNMEKALIYKSFPVKMSLTEKELKLAEYPSAKEAMERVIYLQERLDYLKDVLDSLEDLKFNISRELSRRGVDFTDANRSARVGVE